MNKVSKTPFGSLRNSWSFLTPKEVEVNKRLIFEMVLCVIVALETLFIIGLVPMTEDLRDQVQECHRVAVVEKNVVECWE